VELLCPDCLSPLASADGQIARCPAHGGEFQILFARNFVPNIEPDAPPVIPTATCARHPSITVAYFCAKCGAGICDTCDREQPDGSHLCPSCVPETIAPQKIEMPFSGLSMLAPEPIAPPPLALKVPVGVRCVQHPHLQALNKCLSCGAFMCQTCTFDAPGGSTICPECAVEPKIPFNANRKKNLVGSYICAVWCTLVLIAMSFGMYRNMARDPDNLTALNLLITVTLVVPSLVGLGMGVSTMGRRIPTSIAAWIAIIWNALFVLRHILLVFLNLLS